MTATLEAANEALRTAVRERLGNTPADDPKLVGYAHSPTESCCEGTRMRSEVHPTSQAFFELCDQLKELHRLKSSDYGSANDPLANIRNGAEFVGIEAWRAAMVRLSDKVTRLATYCRTGSLTFEGVEDTLFDLASYSLLTLLTHREAKREP
jgi:hypothetical protein